MHNIEMMKEKLCKELDSYGGVQSLNKGTICEMKEIAQTIHYLNKIGDHEKMEEMEKESSKRGSYHGMYEGTYNDGSSHRRGRNAMGQFVSRDMGPRGNAREYGSYEDGSYGGSYGGSYDNMKASMMSELEELSQKARQDPQMKQALDQCMDRIERM